MAFCSALKTRLAFPTGPADRRARQRTRGYMRVISQTYCCKLALSKSKPLPGHDQPWWPQCDKLRTGSINSAHPSTRRGLGNDIDMAVLPDVTDQHRKDLGVWPGHGLKMLRAMRDPGDPLVVAAMPSAPPATEPTRTRGTRWVRRYRTPLPTPLLSKVLHG
jgi:hypothetical protein